MPKQIMATSSGSDSFCQPPACFMHMIMNAHPTSCLLIWLCQTEAVGSTQPYQHTQAVTSAGSAEFMAVGSLFTYDFW